MSTSPLCGTCGANPCYNICPTQDPYQGDQYAEAMDHEFNARYDDVRERYASTAEDADLFSAEEHAEMMVEVAEAHRLSDEERYAPFHPSDLGDTDEIPF
jgi:hypothetical protein